MENNSGGTMEKTRAEEKIQRDKRKSAVLIAAQSLDQEVQNVKNLKRLSIGSMDLLIDPELEYTVNNPSSPPSSVNSQKSYSSNETTYETAETSLDKKEGSYLEDSVVDASNSSIADASDSFDTTGVEYLHDGNEPVSSNEQLDSIKTVKENELSQPQSKRNLSGIGGLRRSSRNVTSKPENETQVLPKRKLENKKAFTNNLLWVPANQHPSVKPQNFVELVHDTLQNMSLDDVQTNESESKNEVSKDLLNTFSRDMNMRNKSLVRRPSRLRKSYTEFEEETEEEVKPTTSSNNINESNKKNVQGKRAVSLKDIADELTVISNNVGLSNSDAISLARSLSIAGSIGSTSEEEEEDKVLNTSSIGQSEEVFASNILAKNGISIPARSSLRRSKFNTYKIRTSGSSQKDELSTAPIILNSDGGNIGSLRRTSSSSYIETKNRQEGIFDHTQRKLSSGSIGSSDNSTGALPVPHDSDKDFDLSHSSFSNDSSNISSDLSLESVLIHPSNSQSMLQENLHISSSDGYSPNKELVSASSSIQSDHDSPNDPPTNSVDPDDHVVSNKYEINSDFLNTAFAERTKSQKVLANRSNHTKNRHSPIITKIENKKGKKNTSTSNLDDKERLPDSNSKSSVSSNGNVSDSSDNHKIENSNSSSNDNEPSIQEHKKERFEKKLVNLFRRKGNSKSPAKDKLTRKSQNHVIKKKSSLTNIRLRIGSYKQEELSNSKSTKPSEEAQEKPEGNQDYEQAEEEIKDVGIINSTTEDVCQEEPIDDPADDTEEEDYDANESATQLQPALNVVRTANDNCIVESVNELDDDEDSQDFSNGSIYTESIALQKNTYATKDVTIQNNDLANQAPPTILPPRKLTFEDVERLDRPNGSMVFTDSAFGFPLPLLTVSTVIMFDHRLPVNVERAIYRLSHLKLSDSRRSLREQVLLSNFMYAYLHLVNHSLYMEQVEEESMDASYSDMDNSEIETAIADNDPNKWNSNSYRTNQNDAHGAISIPDL
ncbi:hypothetical protein Kpol_1069p2 [Vanderwaltozyma polyspora DSM 70294]|uniref:Protein Zds1 C-terminal domain-containing protein n=1 Tax=Vanderwaltozyma polyspora (strain ATCC 22028 / DSM 70294 / BCRC 21397 / CBS 2163 / NBRC 10782 / NRRL Y-8283 / UCD 57-17) TaxID=436907 RepID=A7TRB2_VANPO|nr:uncharacterized protein Kpol_1069p2 [Vanderwaltozyma polyspora DSM 70294]EDO15180.1 hypothetical protein Kpol_1069p2 [Vanderwaltozyma polyspora DSM 70294]